MRGPRGLEEYRQRRKLETDEIENFRDGDCFHNGFHVLDVVHDMHKDLLENIRPSDHITKVALSGLISDMLVESEARPAAKFLYLKSIRLINEAEKQAKTAIEKRWSSQSSLRADSPSVKTPPMTPPVLPPGRVTRRHERYSMSSFRRTASPEQISPSQRQKRYTETDDSLAYIENPRPNHPLIHSKGLEYPTFATFKSLGVDETNNDSDSSTWDIDQTLFSRKKEPRSIIHQNPASTRKQKQNYVNESTGLKGLSRADDVVPEHSGKSSQRQIVAETTRASKADAPVASPSEFPRGGQHSHGLSTSSRKTQGAERTSNVSVPARPLSLEAKKELPELSLEELKRWKKHKKLYRGSSFQKLPHEDLLEGLSGRDHVSSNQFMINGSNLTTRSS